MATTTSPAPTCMFSTCLRSTNLRCSILRCPAWVSTLTEWQCWIFSTILVLSKDTCSSQQRRKLSDKESVERIHEPEDSCPVESSRWCNASNNWNNLQESWVYWLVEIYQSYRSWYQNINKFTRDSADSFSKFFFKGFLRFIHFFCTTLLSWYYCWV